MYVMNVTDIDDKIIKRARQSYLYDQYLTENRTRLSKVICDVIKASKLYENQYNNEPDDQKRNMMTQTVRSNSLFNLIPFLVAQGQ
jgi:cysteinyl-tRNA synthetase